MNTTYPGRPAYTGPDSGFAAYVHHNRRFEYCWSFEERITVIMHDKPEQEQAIRLHCLAYIALPPDMPWVAESARLRAESYRLWTEGSRLWTEHRDEVDSIVDRLVPDAPWDGHELVFPLPDQAWYRERKAP